MGQGYFGIDNGFSILVKSGKQFAEDESDIQERIEWVEEVQNKVIDVIDVLYLERQSVDDDFWFVETDDFAVGFDCSACQNGDIQVGFGSTYLTGWEQNSIYNIEYIIHTLNALWDVELITGAFTSEKIEKDFELMSLFTREEQE